MGDILALCRHVRFIILGYQGDLASSNMRCKLFIRSRLLLHSRAAERTGEQGFAAFLDGRCLAHILQRIFGLAFDSPRLIGRMHAISLVAHTVSLHNRLTQAVAKIVASTLDYIRCAEVPAHSRQHARDVMYITMERPLRTRGRTDGEAPAPPFPTTRRQ